MRRWLEVLGVALVFLLAGAIRALAAPAVIDVAVGDHHTCVVVGTGHVACWGSNLPGDLGGAPGGELSGAIIVPGIVDAIKIATSSNRTCVLREGGRVSCWLHDSPPSAVEEVRLPRADELAVGDETACVRAPGGRVYCWDRWRAVRPVQGVSGAVQIGLNNWGHGCALRRDGTVWCWGSWHVFADWDPGLRAYRVPRVTGAVQIAVSGGTACALLRGGDVRCWARLRGLYKPTGLTGAAEVLVVLDVPCIRRRVGPPLCHRYDSGDQDPPTPAPRPEPRLAALRVVSAGGTNVCGIRAAGDIVCWGRNEHGQLGSRTPGLSREPVDVLELDDAMAIAAGRDHTCALRRGGAVTCWGRAFGSRNPDRPHFHPRPRAAAVDGPVVRLVPGGQAGISADGVLMGFDGSPVQHVSGGGVEAVAGAWVRMRNGRIVSPAARERPRELVGVDEVVQMSAGYMGLCLVYRDGRLGCHGYEFSGLPPKHCSRSPRMNVHCRRDPPPETPTIVASGVRQVAVGWPQLCAVLRSGKVSCRADTENGRFGEKGSFEVIPGLDRIRMVAVSDWSDGRACAVREDGRLFCWGAGSLGMPGWNDNAAPDRYADLGRVPGLDDVVDVALGKAHSCALRRGGRVACWGNNDVGQLGNGTSGTALVPQRVERLDELFGRP